VKRQYQGLDPRFPYCATGRPDHPFGDSIYSANRGHGAVCWGLSDSAMGGLNPIGFRFVLISAFYKTVSLN